jgi:hypothetical protein
MSGTPETQPVLDLKLYHTTARREIVALRDFDPANVSDGSSSVDYGTFRHVKILVRCAAKLAFGPVGESPAGGNYPVATVVISGNGEGD